MAAFSVNVTAPGSSESTSYTLLEGTTLATLLEDYMDITGAVSVTVNGNPVDDFSIELNAGDTVVVSAKKHKSGQAEVVAVVTIVA